VRSRRYREDGCTLLLSSQKELLPSVNHDRLGGAALSADHQGDGMIINAVTARIEWADRVARQAEQLLIIASATNDDDMRDELRGYAERLDEQSAWIRASAA
jgi:hypothetical protein